MSSSTESRLNESIVSLEKEIQFLRTALDRERARNQELSKENDELRGGIRLNVLAENQSSTTQVSPISQSLPKRRRGRPRALPKPTKVAGRSQSFKSEKVSSVSPKHPTPGLKLEVYVDGPEFPHSLSSPPPVKRRRIFTPTDDESTLGSDISDSDDDFKLTPKRAHRVPVLESSEDEYELPSTSTSRKKSSRENNSHLTQEGSTQFPKFTNVVIPYKPSSSLSQLLQTLPANSLENESTPNCIVSRQDLVKKYHIPNTGLICNKGAHRFVLPTRNLNPHIPNTVGAPGLFFGARMELTEGVWHCFIPRKVDKQTKQEYIGDYEFEYIATLDSDDFQGFSTKEKQDWGHNILAKRMIPLYCAMRARIGLRLSTGSQSNPTNKEIETQLRRLHNRTKAGSVKDSSLPPAIEVTTDDIIAALENGTELIPILRMVCKKYDDDFAKSLQ